MFPTSEKVLPTGATPGRKLGREGRRNSDVIKMPRKVDANDHGMLCRVPTSEVRFAVLEAYWSSLDSVSLSLQLDPTAQQYRLMVVVRHVEDIAWTPEESKTEEGLENFDPAENYRRTCEIRVGTSVLWSCRSSQPTNCLLLCAMSPSTLCSMWNTRSSLPSRYNT
jgi:hypothetical protein